MQEALRVGAAVYNAGEYHAAHDAWEDRWLDLESGTDDERLLHGLIQFTAAVFHARRGNWSGATGLAESAGAYLAPLPADYRAVNVETVRRYLDALGTDPERIERARPPELTVDGDAVGLADLDFEGAARAAEILAEDDDRYDAAVLQEATERARAEQSAEEGATRFTALVMDFATESERRGLIYRRLSDHLDRVERREADVEGLFD